MVTDLITGGGFWHGLLHPFSSLNEMALIWVLAMLFSRQQLSIAVSACTGFFLGVCAFLLQPAMLVQPDMFVVWLPLLLLAVLQFSYRSAMAWVLVPSMMLVGGLYGAHYASGYSNYTYWGGALFSMIGMLVLTSVLCHLSFSRQQWVYRSFAACAGCTGLFLIVTFI